MDLALKYELRNKLFPRRLVRLRLPEPARSGLPVFCCSQRVCDVLYPPVVSDSRWSVRWSIFCEFVVWFGKFLFAIDLWR